MRITLTEKQTTVLLKLEGQPLTVVGLVDVLNRYDGQWNRDQVDKILRRLEDRDLVRRVLEHGRQVNTWEVTNLGRSAVR